MRRWLVTVLLAVLLAVLVLSAPLWAPPFLGFVGARSDLIQGLEALLQIVLAISSGLLFYFGWLKLKKKEAAASPPAAPPPAVVHQAKAGKKGVAVAGDNHGDINIS